MRRTPPPRRKQYLAKSQKPFRARKADPSKRRWASHRCDPYREWLKAQPCCVTGKRTAEFIYDPAFACNPWRFVCVDPAHTRPRSLGADDLYECLPLARHLHDEQEAIGWPRFEAKYGIDRVAIAREHTERFLALHPEFGGADTP